MILQSSLPPVVRILIEAGRFAPSADNLQPWKFCWIGERLTVKYDSKRVTGKTFGPEEHATLLAMGAVKENIIQLAESLEVQIEELEIDSATGYFQFVVKNVEKDKFTSFEHHILQRHTNRWPYTNQPIPNSVVDEISQMSQGECQTLVFTDREMIKKFARWIRIASEARFQSADLHEFLGQSLRFTSLEASQGDGLDIRTLPLPAGGKAFLRWIKDWNRLALLNRIGAYKILALMEAIRISHSQTLIAIVGPQYPANYLEAGMLMERVWLSLNAKAIAVHPYYVITDQLGRLNAQKVQEGLREMIEGLCAEVSFGLPHGKFIHMLFRVGYPREAPIRSLRIPVKKVLELV